MATNYDGNTNAQKYTEEEAVELFNKMFEYAKTDKCYCIQDAFLEIGVPCTTFYHLINKYPSVKSIKRDIDSVIISKINKGALFNEMNPTASIWRMKQLGEEEKKNVIQINSSIELTEEEIKKAKETINKLDI